MGHDSTNSPKKIQKAASLLVSKFEDKVDKILRTFIFKSGGKIQSEALTQSQKAPVMSQDHDPLMDPVVQDDRDVSELHQECSLLVADPDLQWLFPWIFIVGELSVLGMEESEEGNLSKLNIRSGFRRGVSFSVRDKTVTLLKSLTTNSLPTVNPKQPPILIPSCISFPANRAFHNREHSCARDDQFRQALHHVHHTGEEASPGIWNCVP